MKYKCQYCRKYNSNCDLYKEKEPETCEVYKLIIKEYKSIDNYKEHVSELERIVQGEWDIGT